MTDIGSFWPFDLFKPLHQAFGRPSEELGIYTAVANKRLRLMCISGTTLGPHLKPLCLDPGCLSLRVLSHGFVKYIPGKVGQPASRKPCFTCFTPGSLLVRKEGIKFPYNPYRMHSQTLQRSSKITVMS